MPGVRHPSAIQHGARFASVCGQMLLDLGRNACSGRQALTRACSNANRAHGRAAKFEPSRGMKVWGWLLGPKLELVSTLRAALVCTTFHQDRRLLSHPRIQQCAKCRRLIPLTCSRPFGFRAVRLATSNLAGPCLALCGLLDACPALCNKGTLAPPGLARMLCSPFRLRS